MEEEPLVYRTLPVSGPGNLAQPVDLALCTLRAASDSLLHEVLFQHHRLPGNLSLVPVNVGTHSQDGETYLTVRYRFQVLPDEPNSPSNHK